MRTTSAIALALVLIGCSDDESSSTGVGGSDGSGGSSSSTVTPTMCDYPQPATGVGVEVGQTLPVQLTWMGFTPGAVSAEEVPIASLHDCDGTHGIHALLLSTLQPETSAGANFVADIRDSLDAYQTRGIAVVFLLLNDPDGNEVTIEGTGSWRQSFMLEETAWVLADEDFLLVSGGQVNTPQNTLVDPRTMQVTEITEGHPFDPANLEAMADANAP